MTPATPCALHGRTEPRDRPRGGPSTQRLGEPQDVTSVVAFLLPEDAGWVTGQTIVADGGQMITGGV